VARAGWRGSGAEVVSTGFGVLALIVLSFLILIPSRDWQFPGRVRSLQLNDDSACLCSTARCSRPRLFCGTSLLDFPDGGGMEITRGGGERLGGCRNAS